MKTKVFLDTNVLLDCIVQGRQNAMASMTVIDLVKQHQLEAVATTQSILDMAYVDRYGKNHESFVAFVSWMLNCVNVEYIDTFDIEDAIASGGTDLEDEAQVAHAVTSACHFFITSDKELLKKDIPGMEFISPEEFVKKINI